LLRAATEASAFAAIGFQTNKPAHGILLVSGKVSVRPLRVRPKTPLRNNKAPLRQAAVASAFSSEADTGSREENA